MVTQTPGGCGYCVQAAPSRQSATTSTRPVCHYRRSKPIAKPSGPRPPLRDDRGRSAVGYRLCLARQDPDRGRKLVAAIVAGPGVVDAAVRAKRGPLGNKQRRAAAWTSGPAQFGAGGERGLKVHRRTPRRLTPDMPNLADIARVLWRVRDAPMKVSWHRRISQSRNRALRKAMRKSLSMATRQANNRCALRRCAPTRTRLRPLPHRLGTATGSQLVRPASRQSSNLPLA